MNWIVDRYANPSWPNDKRFNIGGYLCCSQLVTDKHQILVHELLCCHCNNLGTIHFGNTIFWANTFNIYHKIHNHLSSKYDKWCWWKKNHGNIKVCTLMSKRKINTLKNFVFRILIFSCSIISTIYEIFSVDLGYGPTLDYLMNKNNSINKPKNLKSLNFIIIACVLTLTLIQLRIIYDDWKNEPNQQVAESEDRSVYSKGTIRLVSFLSLIFVLLLIIWLNIRSHISDPNLSRLRVHIMSNCIIFIVIPAILICRNENMLSYCINCLKYLFKCSLSQNTNPPSPSSQNVVNNNTISLQVEQNVWLIIDWLFVLIAIVSNKFHHRKMDDITCAYTYLRFFIWSKKNCCNLVNRH